MFHVSCICAGKLYIYRVTQPLVLVHLFHVHILQCTMITCLANQILRPEGSDFLPPKRPNATTYHSNKCTYKTGKI